MLTILGWIARLYLWSLVRGKRAFFYSINAMRKRHPAARRRADLVR